MTTVKNKIDDDGIRTITLNRPERLNAINHELLADLKAALAEGNADPETRVIILRGIGRAFCAGDDLKDFGDQAGDEAQTRAYVDAIQAITREIVLNDKFVVGAVHGWAVGGGLEWALNCDFTVMARGTRCFFPEIQLGLGVTGGVTTILPKLTGLQKAKELILFGERFDAGDALKMGIVWKLVPESEIRSEARSLARRIAAMPQGAASRFKCLITQASHMGVEDAMALEAEATVQGFLDPKTAERIDEFVTGGGKKKKRDKKRKEK